jgi:hypothetical protein
MNEVRAHDRDPNMSAPGSPANGGARVFVLEDNHCMATWRSFVIVIWRKDTTADAVKQLRDLLQKTSTTTQAVCLLTIVEPNAPPPSSDVRDALAGVLGEFGKLIKYSAVAFEGSGFRAAMVRGVVTGLTMLARMPYPHKVFAGVEESARWLCGNASAVGFRETANEVIDAVAELRRRIAAV